jgi:glycerol kinase
MKKDIGEISGVSAEDALRCLKVDGGASANDLLMQMQSDFSDIEVLRSSNAEATAAGAAYLAGLGCGLYSSVDEIMSLSANSTVFDPKMDKNTRDHYLSGWQNAVKKTTLR